MTRTADRKPDLFGIQILRGVAAAMVVLHHALEESLASKAAPSSPDWLTTFGASGVDIFFVISGFVMVYSGFRSGQPAIRPGKFMAKRIMRIYPLYWACLLLMLALWVAGFYRKFDPSFALIARSALLLPTDKPIVTVSWTLVYEMYFYLLFAGTLFLKSRAASLVATTTAIVLFLGGSLLLGNPTDFLSNAIVIEFCFGMALAVAFPHVATPSARAGMIVGFAALAAAPLIVPHESTNGLPPIARAIAWGLPAAIIVASSLSVDRLRSKLQQALVALGDSSYAIYLTHPFVLVAFARAVKDHPQLTSISLLPFVPLVFAACISAGISAHLLVELPLTRLARRLTASEPRSGQSVTSAN
jgi:exopolysaccharide production protein ExoZ